MKLLQKAADECTRFIYLDTPGDRGKEAAQNNSQELVDKKEALNPFDEIQASLDKGIDVEVADLRFGKNKGEVFLSKDGTDEKNPKYFLRMDDNERLAGKHFEISGDLNRAAINKTLSEVLVAYNQAKTGSRGDKQDYRKNFSDKFPETAREVELSEDQAKLTALIQEVGGLDAVGVEQRIASLQESTPLVGKLREVDLEDKPKEKTKKEEAANVVAEVAQPLGKSSEYVVKADDTLGQIVKDLKVNMGEPAIKDLYNLPVDLEGAVKSNNPGAKVVGMVNLIHPGQKVIVERTAKGALVKVIDGRPEGKVIGKGKSNAANGVSGGSKTKVGPEVKSIEDSNNLQEAVNPIISNLPPTAANIQAYLNMLKKDSSLEFNFDWIKTDLVARNIIKGNLIDGMAINNFGVDDKGIYVSLLGERNGTPQISAKYIFEEGAWVENLNITSPEASQGGDSKDQEKDESQEQIVDVAASNDAPKSLAERFDAAGNETAINSILDTIDGTDPEVMQAYLEFASGEDSANWEWLGSVVEAKGFKVGSIVDGNAIELDSSDDLVSDFSNGNIFVNTDKGKLAVFKNGAWIASPDKALVVEKEPEAEIVVEDFLDEIQDVVLDLDSYSAIIPSMKNRWNWFSKNFRSVWTTVKKDSAKTFPKIKPLDDQTALGSSAPKTKYQKFEAAFYASGDKAANVASVLNEITDYSSESVNR